VLIRNEGGASIIASRVTASRPPQVRLARKVSAESGVDYQLLVGEVVVDVAPRVEDLGHGHAPA